ncbi:MAG: BrnT family toxin [Pseudomonadota bacterium]
MYNKSMFEWNEEKRLKNIAKHAIDFIAACSIFDGRKICTFTAKQENEERFATIGLIENRFIAVIWTRRNDKIRIISARRARDEEKRAYNKLLSN